MGNKLLAISFALIILIPVFALPVSAETYQDEGIIVECEVTQLKLKPGEQKYVYVTIENI